MNHGWNGMCMYSSWRLDTVRVALRSYLQHPPNSSTNHPGVLSLSLRPAFPRLCNPPLNPLSHNVRVGILNCLKQAKADKRRVSCIIITGGEHAFSAGADIKELADDGAAARREPNLVTVVDAIEACKIPVVAAIGGVAFGGGYEVCYLPLHRKASAQELKHDISKRV